MEIPSWDGLTWIAPKKKTVSRTAIPGRRVGRGSRLVVVVRVEFTDVACGVADGLLAAGARVFLLRDARDQITSRNPARRAAIKPWEARMFDSNRSQYLPFISALPLLLSSFD